MHTLLWVWTADAYDAYDNEIVRDGFKYDFGRLRHTKEAHDQLLEGCGSGGLIHEHAVPRRVLVEHIYTQELSDAAASALLETHCFGVIVSASQDGDKLGGNLKSDMPVG